MTMVTSSCALLFACGSCLVYELVTYQDRALDNLSALADTLGASAQPALATNDHVWIEKSLDNIADKKMIAALGVYDAKGRLFAGYSRYGRDSLPERLEAGPRKHGLFATHLDVHMPIQSDGTKTGTIYVQADMRDRQERLEQYFAIVLAVLLASSLAAYVLSCRLQRMISGPILHLAQIARVVSADKDYSIRARRQGNDELGLLVDGFNQMLGHIQHREAALHRALRELKDLEAIVNRSHAIAFQWSGDDGWTVEFVSHNIEHLGYSPDDFISGRVTYSEFVHPDDLERLRSEITRSGREEADVLVQEYRVITKSGEVRWVDDRTWICRREDGTIAHYQGLVLDITDRKLAEEQLHQGRENLETRVKQRTAELAETNMALQKEIAERRRTEIELLSMREILQQQATHDPLTGLPNRLLFSDRLNQQIALAHRNRRVLAVMFLDLDRFKEINDTLGHNVGDMLLKDVADRLTYCVRDADTLARMGGDEFTIILGEINSEQEALIVAQRVIDSMGTTFKLDGHEVSISVSIGVSLYPSHGADVETLVRNADRAMYHAKEQGRNRCQVYLEHFDNSVASCERLELDIEKALERNEFVLHYQPRVDLKTGKTMGTEALLRWQHPELGLLYPDKFLDVAETSGSILAVDEWVMENACLQNKKWQDSGMPPIEIAVNLSAGQLERPDLPEMVSRTLKRTQLEARYLTLEFTESALLTDPDLSARVLGALRAIGVRVSIDDFGAANSSLSSLRDLPVDAVKIDRSFVRDVTSDPDVAAVAGAIVAVAHNLHKVVVAEGVETLSQLEFLRSLNCDEMQGYFVSKPAPAEAFETDLKRAAWERMPPAA